MCETRGTAMVSAWRSVRQEEFEMCAAAIKTEQATQLPAARAPRSVAHAHIARGRMCATSPPAPASAGRAAAGGPRSLLGWEQGEAARQGRSSKWRHAHLAGPLWSRSAPRDVPCAHGRGWVCPRAARGAGRGRVRTVAAAATRGPAPGALRLAACAGGSRPRRWRRRRHAAALHCRQLATRQPRRAARASD